MSHSANSSAIPAAIRPESSNGSKAADRSDAAIAELASARHGLVTLAELKALGLSPRAVSHRVASGRLHRVHRGIYARDRLTNHGRWMAAVIASGPGALLSHGSAAALWGLATERGRDIHVTVARAAHRRPGIVLHGRCRVEDDDIASCEGIPCTSVARTLIDHAATVDRRGLVKAVDRAEELRLFDLAELSDTLRRCERRRGAPLLRDVLAEYDVPLETASVAEERFLALVDSAGLSRPLVNHWMPLGAGNGYRPDFFWPEARLVVEIDGRTHHARKLAFEHDRQRDRRLALAGLTTCRYAAKELTKDPEGVVDEVRRLLVRTVSSR